jgi:hypothetical protein
VVRSVLPARQAADGSERKRAGKRARAFAIDLGKDVIDPEAAWTPPTTLSWTRERR